MADATNETPKAQRAPKAPAEKPSIEQLVGKLQSIGDYEKRKAFYNANPELKTIISPINFPT